MDDARVITSHDGGRHDVRCACGQKCGADVCKRASFTQALRRVGWRWSRSAGWQCPQCAEARDG
jgi:hypothetical protein